jgi:formamidopyrimidine-DNA glycosylase
MIEAHALGRTVKVVRRTRARLRSEPARDLRALRGRRLERAWRHGKYLLLGFGDTTLLSHLGMSGCWLFGECEPPARQPHVLARIGFADGTWLWYRDPRRFGQLRIVPTGRVHLDASIAILGPDPLAVPPDGAALAALARGLRASIKSFLLDQRRLAGIGNIYASEILFRAAVDPRRPAGRLTRGEWDRLTAEVPAVLGEAAARMGTTLSTYRTPWNEPGLYGDQLLVYDRAGEPCRRCGAGIRRIVLGGRSTYFCPACQGRRPRIRARPRP